MDKDSNNNKNEKYDAGSSDTDVEEETLVGIGILDNFFDVLKSSGSLLVNLNTDKLPDAVKDMSGPEKESMPFQFGSGTVTGTAVRGLTRNENSNHSMMNSSVTFSA